MVLFFYFVLITSRLFGAFFWTSRTLKIGVSTTQSNPISFPIDFSDLNIALSLGLVGRNTIESYTQKNVVQPLKIKGKRSTPKVQFQLIQCKKMYHHPTDMKCELILKLGAEIASSEKLSSAMDRCTVSLERVSRSNRSVDHEKWGAFGDDTHAQPIQHNLIFIHQYSNNS